MYANVITPGPPDSAPHSLAKVSLGMATVALGLMLLLLPTAAELGDRSCRDLSKDATPAWVDILALAVPVIGTLALVAAARARRRLPHPAGRRPRDRRLTAATVVVWVTAGLWAWFVLSAISLVGC